MAQTITKEEAERQQAEEALENAEEAKRIRTWVRNFSDKEYWCKQYLTMRKTFMKLGGLDPIKEGFDEAAWVFPVPIEPKKFADAIEAVRETYGLSHYTSSAFARVSERIHRTTVDLRYDTRQEAR